MSRGISVERAVDTCPFAKEAFKKLSEGEQHVSCGFPDCGARFTKARKRIRGRLTKIGKVAVLESGRLLCEQIVDRVLQIDHLLERGIGNRKGVPDKRRAELEKERNLLFQKAQILGFFKDEA